MIYPVSYSCLSQSVTFFSHLAALLRPFHSHYFLVTSCFPTTLLYTLVPLPLFTLPQHPFSPSSVIQRAGGGGEQERGSLLWSDSYKILIGTRNMIAREKGGWNGEKGGRDGEEIFPWIKALSQQCLLFFSLFCTILACAAPSLSPLHFFPSHLFSSSCIFPKPSPSLFFLLFALTLSSDLLTGVNYWS